MSDLLKLLQLLDRYLDRAKQINGLLQRMREEGREALTAGELQELKDADDAAHQAQIEALNG